MLKRNYEIGIMTNSYIDETPTLYAPSPNANEIYQAVENNLEKWLLEDLSRLNLFTSFVEFPSTNKILDQVRRKTPAGYGIVVEVINAIFV